MPTRRLRRPSEVERVMPVPPERVFAVLADGWLYAAWVVGASRIRAVDQHWPAAGSRIHHSVGVWPLLLDDHTEVVEALPPRRLVLRPRARPLGAALVELELFPAAAGTRVVLREFPTNGPAVLAAPLALALVPPRNREALRRLEYLAIRPVVPRTAR